MEKVVARENMRAALKRVEENKGAGGIDGVQVDELRELLREVWPQVREQLLQGTYQPKPVRRVEIPKPGGGTRLLGIPTVLDRLIQQALLQVLTPIFDPTFSEASYGFRRNKRAHDAVRVARRYVEAGYDWVVDMDIQSLVPGTWEEVEEGLGRYGGGFLILPWPYTVSMVPGTWDKMERGVQLVPGTWEGMEEAVCPCGGRLLRFSC